MRSHGRLRIVVAGYLVRYPVGGYAWQAAHYLLGLSALGHDVWFYEETGYYPPAYNPISQEFGQSYEYGIAAAGEFLRRIGLGDRWVFTDTFSGTEHGPGSGRAGALLRESDLLVSLSGVNRIPSELRNGRPDIYIDLDPAFTQMKLANGDKALREMLDQHAWLFTFGENIGTSRSPIPTGGYTWHPTRQPVVIGLWMNAGPPRLAYTTIGKWNGQDRDLEYAGERYGWSKRDQWLRCLDLPLRSHAEFEMAMDVKTPDDHDRLTTSGWQIVDPLKVSSNPWRYREYIRASRAEFSIAKDMNVRLRSGWFSDRSACYLAAGRPVVLQDTGFGESLPLGPGLHAFANVDEATDAVGAIEADYSRASAHASDVAREYFDAERVLGEMLRTTGL
jgi:hypothetical protein